MKDEMSENIEITPMIRGRKLTRRGEGREVDGFDVDGFVGGN